MTEVEICNAALTALGTEGIVTLNDDSDEARACQAFYPLVRDKVLEDRIWTFAKKQYVLSNADNTAPLFGFSKRFLLPGEVIRVHRVDDGTSQYRVQWELMGRYIHTDETRVYITAVRRETDSSLYSPGFSMAVALRLAVVLSVPLKENRQLKADLWAEYQAELKEAAGVDGSQGTSERTRSDFLSRRR